MTQALARRPKLRDTALIERGVTILDEYGKPIGPPTTRRIVAEANPRGMQTFSSHPEIGLTPELLAAYQRAAELGAPMRQFDVWDGLLNRHADAAGMFAERNEDVSGCDFSVMAPADRNDKPSRIAAAKLQEYLQYSARLDVASPSMGPSFSFRTWIEHQLTAIPYGFAPTNLVWDFVEDVIVPVRFEPVAQRRFQAPAGDRANEIWLIDGSRAPFNLIQLEAGLWSVTRNRGRNPYNAGLMTSCSWWMMFALLQFKQWCIFGEMFGLPLAVGYYDEGASTASRNALEDAVRAIGQDGYAVLSKLTELVIAETARGGDSSTVYPLIMKACDAQLTKRITGGTLNTDVSSTGAGSYNAASVHESRQFKMKRRDATRAEAEFTCSIGTTFIVWNGYDRAAPPVLKIKIARDELARAQTLEIIGQAMDLSKMQIQTEFNVREPTGPDDVVRFQPTKPPDPGKARQEKQ
jgi:phage gp29-like protein